MERQGREEFDVIGSAADSVPDSRQALHGRSPGRENGGRGNGGRRNEEHTERGMELRMQDIMRMMDLKSIFTPECFDGKDEHFAQWKRNFQAALMPWGIKRLLQAAVEEAEEPQHHRMTAEQITWSNLLYSVLTGVMKNSGKGKMIVERIADENGFMAWRQLKKEYQPRHVDRHAAVTAGLMNPSFTDDDFYEEFLQWELDWANFTRETHVEPEEGELIATIVRTAPPKIRAYLQIAPMGTTDSYK